MLCLAETLAETMIVKSLPALVVLFSMLATGAGGHSEHSDDTSTGFLIDNVMVIDGSGAQGSLGAVRIAGDTIVEVGELEPHEGEIVIDGGGQVLAPGFIDTHSHADDGIGERRDALAVVGQGITTVVVGQDGGSPFPLSDWFESTEKAPAAVNVAAYAGHNTLREHVLGENYRRVATAGEIESMSSLLQAELDAGAIGLSTGLEYEPGIYSESAEVIALARVAAASDSRYISHVRSEDRWFWKAIDEIVEIGRITGMPVQISHIKLAMKSAWGRAGELIAKLDAARTEGIDITADIYPYEYWQSNMMVLIPSRDLQARDEYEFALREIAPPAGFWLTRFDPQPEYVGKRLTEIAELRGTDPVTAMMQLTAESAAFQTEDGSHANSMIGTSMIEQDIRELLAWPHANVCTDGSLDDLHPRGTAAFPRVLGRYARDQGMMRLEQAIHKMTGLSAAHMGFTKRGLIRPGQAADLVLFDPATVIDHATPDNPQAPNTGITRVWVNGQVVFDKGAASGLYPGRVIRREGA